MERTSDPVRQAELMKEVARVWEQDLGNKWEALDAWKEVLARHPDDAEATEAIKRLGHSTRRLSAAELRDLADSSEVALPPAEAGGSAPSETGEHTFPGRDDAALEFDEETDLSSRDDLPPVARPPSDLHEALAFATEAEQTREEPKHPTADEPMVVPGAPGSAGDFAGDDETDDGRVITSELDVSDLGEPSRAAAFDDDGGFDDAPTGADDADDAVDIDTGDVEIETGPVESSYERIDTGDVLIDEDSRRARRRRDPRRSLERERQASNDPPAPASGPLGLAAALGSTASTENARRRPLSPLSGGSIHARGRRRWRRAISAQGPSGSSRR